MFAAQLCIDSVFETLGIDATLDPDGVATSVKVLPSEEDRELNFGSTQIVDAGGVYEIRMADFQGFSDGAEIEVSDQRRSVQSHKIRDPRRLKVTLYTVEIR